jgi:arylsulfatase A-like enzyme
VKTELSWKIILFVLSFTVLTTGIAYSAIDYLDSDAGESKPNVVVVDIDRLNKDRMPCYGHYRNTTPNICGFGEKNILFEDAVTQSGWTASSIASVFTSQHPGAHGLLTHKDSLPDQKNTMPEVLTEKGYETAAFPVYRSDDPSELRESYNLDQGFQTYRKGNYFLRDQNRDLSKWLEDRDEEPYFLYIQAFDPHTYDRGESYTEIRRYRDNYSDRVRDSIKSVNPTEVRLVNGIYTAPGPNGTQINLTKQEVEYLKAEYDDILVETDRQFGKLVDILKSKQIYSDSIIIFTANHGEVFDTRNISTENKRFAHGNVYEGNIQVPLMIKTPNEKSETVDQQVSLIDLYPTVMDEINEDMVDREFQGQSLKPLYQQNGNYSTEYAFTTSYDGRQIAVRNSSWKLIVKRRGAEELYNLENDPNEHTDLAEEHPEILVDMRERIERKKTENKVLAAR